MGKLYMAHNRVGKFVKAADGSVTVEPLVPVVTAADVKPAPTVAQPLKVQPAAAGKNPAEESVAQFAGGTWNNKNEGLKGREAFHQRSANAWRKKPDEQGSK